MPQGYSKEIRRNGVEFQTEDQEAAAEELEEFWEESDGEMSWGEMGDRGNYSRTQYSRVFNMYYEPVEGEVEQQTMEEDPEPEPEPEQTNQTTQQTESKSEPMQNVEIPNSPIDAFVKGYQMGKKSE